MTIHVFAGPSLSGSPVLELDGVCPHPPIAHGDLYRLRPARGDAVLIVDGVYQHTAPVRHKEILSLYEDGVPIYGTASLGALRACEHLGHGVIGLGTVFGWYQDGRVFSDADVALTHGDADVDYRAFTHALVSIISVTDRMALAGRLDPSTASRIVELARAVHFTIRTNAALLAAARPEGLDEAMRLVLTELRDDRLGDIKRIDAEAAVRVLLDREELEPPDDQVAIPDTTYRREWRLQHTPVTPDPAGPTQRQLLAYAQLFLPDFPDRHTRYVLDNLRPEYPAVGAGGLAPHWLDALTPDDLVHRGLLAPHEAPGEPAALDPEHRAIRVLVRSFRLRSGRLVYEDLPPDLLADKPELADQCARLLGMNERAIQANPNFHPGDLPTDLLETTFARLWNVEHLPTHVLDRGFRSVEDFRQQARPFFIAARAAIAMVTAKETDRGDQPDVGRHADHAR